MRGLSICIAVYFSAHACAWIEIYNLNPLARVNRKRTRTQTRKQCCTWRCVSTRSEKKKVERGQEWADASVEEHQCACCAHGSRITAPSLTIIFFCIVCHE